jgi:hypothetical protein
MLMAVLPCLVALARAEAVTALIVYEVLSPVVVMVLVLLPAGFGRTGEFELPVLLALVLFGSGVVFVRALERWL